MQAGICRKCRLKWPNFVYKSSKIVYNFSQKSYRVASPLRPGGERPVGCADGGDFGALLREVVFDELRVAGEAEGALVEALLGDVHAPAKRLRERAEGEPIATAVVGLPRQIRSETSNKVEKGARANSSDSRKQSAGFGTYVDAPVRLRVRAGLPDCRLLVARDCNSDTGLARRTARQIEKASSSYGCARPGRGHSPRRRSCRCRGGQAGSRAGCPRSGRTGSRAGRSRARATGASSGS